MNIKEKIAKLLALAGSPNENEAKSALLKARALMAEHKLRPEDCAAKKESVIIKTLDDIIYTPMTDFWINHLTNIITEHYCCKNYCNRAPRGKTRTVVLMGLESDVEICERILRYAIECVRAETARIRRNKSRIGYTGRDIRLACNAYGDGFAVGLRQEYQRQDAEHQEWGLVMVTPESVQNAYGQANLRAVKVHYKRAGDWANQYRNKGIADGQAFRPDRRIEN